MTGSVLNIIIKLLAVLLAVLLWFNVISEKQYEYELTLPVTDIEYPSTLGPVTDLPESLTVKVLAEGKRLLRSDWKHAGLRIKATRLTRGINTLDLNLETVSLIRADNVTLLDLPDISPVTVRMDRIDSLPKPIASRLVVIPDDGYMVPSGAVTVDPERAWVIGPVQLLARIDSVYTVQKILDDVQDSVRVTLPLDNPRVGSLRLNRDSATVEVVLDKVRRKELDDIRIEVRTEIAGGRPVVDPEKIGVTIEGPGTLIDTLSPAGITPVVTVSDSIQGGYVRPTIELPDDVTLLRIRPDSVRVIVSP